MTENNIAKKLQAGYCHESQRFSELQKATHQLSLKQQEWQQHQNYKIEKMSERAAELGSLKAEVRLLMKGIKEKTELTKKCQEEALELDDELLKWCGEVATSHCDAFGYFQGKNRRRQFMMDRINQLKQLIAEIMDSIQAAEKTDQLHIQGQSRIQQKEEELRNNYERYEELQVLLAAEEDELESTRNQP